MKWKTQKRWEELKKGINCPICKDGNHEENQFSFLVQELEFSYVRLPKNQYMRGYIIVMLKRHANELFDLTEKERTGFWNEVSKVAKVLYNIYQPTKIDYLIFGHHCPHIHCHLVLQSYNSDPSKAVKMDEKEVFLPKQVYANMIKQLRFELNKHY